MTDLIGTKRKCILCDKEGNRIVEIIDVIPEGDHFRQKLSCGHTSKYVASKLEERIEISTEVKSRAIDHKYGQTHRTGPKDTRNMPCKDCGHNGTEHKFTPGYTGNHNCYLCKCPNYRPDKE